MCAQLAKLASHAVGDGLDAATEMSPLQKLLQFDMVKEFLEDARVNDKVIADFCRFQRSRPDATRPGGNQSG